MAAHSLITDRSREIPSNTRHQQAHRRTDGGPRHVHTLGRTEKAFLGDDLQERLGGRDVRRISLTPPA